MEPGPAGGSLQPVKRVRLSCKSPDRGIRYRDEKNRWYSEPTTPSCSQPNTPIRRRITCKTPPSRLSERGTPHPLTPTSKTSDRRDWLNNGQSTPPCYSHSPSLPKMPGLIDTHNFTRNPAFDKSTAAFAASGREPGPTSQETHACMLFTQEVKMSARPSNARRALQFNAPSDGIPIARTPLSETNRGTHRRSCDGKISIGQEHPRDGRQNQRPCRPALDDDKLSDESRVNHASSVTFVHSPRVGDCASLKINTNVSLVNPSWCPLLQSFCARPQADTCKELSVDEQKVGSFLRRVPTVEARSPGRRASLGGC